MDMDQERLASLNSEDQIEITEEQINVGVDLLMRYEDQMESEADFVRRFYVALRRLEGAPMTEKMIEAGLEATYDPHGILSERAMIVAVFKAMFRAYP